MFTKVMDTQRPRPQRRLRWFAPLAIAACWLPSACRREAVWSGAEYGRGGAIIKLSSDEPFCGCLDIVNIAQEPIFIRSVVRLAENKWEPVGRGGVALQPGEEWHERFDWAGLDAKDVYELDAWSRNGKPLKIRDVIRMKGYGWPFAPCDGTECKSDGKLFLNTGAVHQH